MTPVRAVSFDAVGTLLHARPRVAEVYARVARSHGSQLDEETIASRFRRAFARDEKMEAAGDGHTSEARERDRWLRIVSTVIDDVRDPTTVFEELFRHFATPAAWTLYSDVASTLSELARREIPVVLASNFDARLDSVIEGVPELASVQRVIHSAGVGIRKPHPGFFRAVVEALGRPPGEIVHIGDDAGNDVEGARRSGLRALHLVRGSTAPGPDEITSLDGVLTLLSR